ncbi:MAG TPA: DUF6455 family protein [Roseovarius sp.]|nr:DUF6455 family protein [Roseovarius sp.]
MSSTTTLKRHAGLVDRMANTVGVDLEEKVMQGQLDFDGISDAVLNCVGCTAPDECEHWLALNSSGADSAPGMCRNSELFATLKAGKLA